MEQPRRNKKEFWRSVFRKVMSYYDELKSSHGTNSCEGFYKALSREGTNGGKFNPRVVRATPSDFICDLELAARRVLTKEEHRFFKLVYLQKDAEIIGLLEDKSPDNKFNKLKHTVQEKMGLAFKARGMYPIAKYLRPKDLR
jgi:hypothetical protein